LVEALPSTASVGGRPPLFGRFIGTMAPSDFSPTCMLGVRLTAFPSRPEPTFGHGRDLPGSVQRTSPRAWGLRLREVPSLQASCAGTDVAFSSAVRDRHLGIRPVSQLNTQPVVSPVNASRRPSRDAAHHSGPGRLARPYPVKDLHLLSFASFSWRTLRWVKRCRIAGFPAASDSPPIAVMLRVG
jgi:hypothetical protein